ncbi:MAG: dephospho-CoA kinase [Myxococcota bacterium]|nr:dephospho-CoA kinase [Myxococcota bacterium]
MSPKKQLWLLAGGNGSGKSTFYELFLKPTGILFINADLIAKRIDPHQGPNVGYQAATIAERFRNELLEQGVSFCFATVFSHPSKVDFTARAKARGYHVILVYIHLSTPQLNEARVWQRVSKGGLSVPREKIYTRLPRTVNHIATVLNLVDEAKLLDNSSTENPYLPVAQVARGRKSILIAPLPSWAKEILAQMP